VKAAKLTSLQVGRPADLDRRGKTVRTAVVKTPVAGHVHLGVDGFEGDEQADLRVQGGPDKAACVYPVEHVERWEAEIGVSLPPGAFGENLSVSGLLERHVYIGDRYALGRASSR
jgi:MOSC domain-containing protein YiiM